MPTVGPDESEEGVGLSDAQERQLDRDARVGETIGTIDAWL